MSVCDQTIGEYNLRSVNLTKKFSETFVTRQRPVDGLTEGLKEYYNISQNKIPRLKCALISPRAKMTQVRNKISIFVSREFHEST